MNQPFCCSSSVIKACIVNDGMVIAADMTLINKYAAHEADNIVEMFSSKKWM